MNVRILNGSLIKIIAIISMTIDHISRFVLLKIPTFRSSIFEFSGREYSLCKIMNILGRTAFPLFVFLLVEGFMHTHDRKKYGINLFIFAIISEIPWNLVCSGNFSYSRQNVFFTLLLGYLAMCSYEYFKENKWKQILSIVVLLIISFFLRADYSYIGFIFIFAMYMLRFSCLTQGLITCGILGGRIFCAPAAVCMNLYNGKRGFIRGKIGKYFFYFYYPVHLLILYFIARL